MEYVSGGSITKLLADRGGRGLPSSLALPYMGQLLTGLAYLHGKGILHRDIKGANILLANDGKANRDGVPSLDCSSVASAAKAGEVSACVKIADFGSARLLQHGAL